MSDDDDILALTIPAGTLARAGRGRFVLARPIGPVVKLSLVLGKHGAVLQLATGPTDLSRADRVDHMVTVSLAAGTYRASQTRLWVLRDGGLAPGGR